MGLVVSMRDDRTIADSQASRRARLYWQCRRGMLELDLVLQSFLDQGYDRAAADEQRAFEALLNYPDPLLLEYVMGNMLPADPVLARVVGLLRNAPAA